MAQDAFPFGVLADPARQAALHRLTLAGAPSPPPEDDVALVLGRKSKWSVPLDDGDLGDPEIALLFKRRRQLRIDPRALPEASTVVLHSTGYFLLADQASGRPFKVWLQIIPHPCVLATQAAPR